MPPIILVINSQVHRDSEDSVSLLIKHQRLNLAFTAILRLGYAFNALPLDHKGNGLSHFKVLFDLCFQG